MGAGVETAGTGTATAATTVSLALTSLGFLTFSALTEASARVRGTEAEAEATEATEGVSTISGVVLDLLILGILLYYTIGKSF